MNSTSSFLPASCIVIVQEEVGEEGLRTITYTCAEVMLYTVVIWQKVVSCVVIFFTLFT